MQLRDYQSQAITDINNAWLLVPNVLYVLPCRAGKTVIVSALIQSEPGGVVFIAHRTELVEQASRTLARNGVSHRIIGAKTTQDECRKSHMRNFQRNFVDPQSHVAVASIDTLVNYNPNDPWLLQVKLWVTDEANHLQAENKWGRGVAMFPNARGLGVTATPCRGDGKGLGRSNDGVFDVMVQGPTMRTLIDRGYINDYRIFCPPSDLDLSDVAVTGSGEFSPVGVDKAIGRSHIIGDVVESYIRIAMGKSWLTFSTSVKKGQEIADEFNAKRIPAAMLSDKTPPTVRAALIAKHQRREILMLVNVGLFGEGNDMPWLEGISDAAPTASFPTFYQRFCRPLNPKPELSIIIDHVGNIMRHGLPDAPQQWTLNRREKRATKDVVSMMRVCPSCTAAYERIEGPRCPYCGEVAVAADRSSPRAVDGDLYELDQEVLRMMRGQIDQPPTYPYGAAPVVVASINKNHRERTEAQTELREAIALWASGKHDIPRAQREFFLTFGIDVLSAQALNRADAITLTERIRKCN